MSCTTSAAVESSRPVTSMTLTATDGSVGNCCNCWRINSTRFSLRSDMLLLPLPVRRERAGVRVLFQSQISNSHFKQLPNPLNQFLNIKRLLHKLIRPSLEQIVDFFLINNSRHDDDFHMLEGRILPDR